MKILRNGALALCLMALCACSGRSLVRTELYSPSPPALFLLDSPAPEPPKTGDTNLDLLVYALDVELALQGCNQDKAHVREYFTRVHSPQ